MWICLNNAFLSVVDLVPRDPDKLMVRARIKGDIRRVFPHAVERESRPEEFRDYRFRAIVDRRLVADMIAASIQAIDYSNFKDSVRENDRHDAYLSMWSAMKRYQDRNRATRGLPSVRKRGKKAPPSTRVDDLLSLDPADVRRHIRPVG